VQQAFGLNIPQTLEEICDSTRLALVVYDMQVGIVKQIENGQQITDGMDGAQFLKRIRYVASSTITLLLTGHLDLHGAASAVNEGSVFRLLIKPCEKSALTEAITKALDSYRERKEERVRIELPVRVCRAAQNQRPQPAHTVDISNSGARLAGLEEPLERGEVVKLECGDREAPFRVVWIGAQGTASAGQAGLECLAADGDFWKFDLRQLEDGKPLMRALAVQRGLLPQEKPPLATLDYEGNCTQARTIGGDYYDFLDMGSGEVGLVLADVAGKGIAAALLMASLQGSLHSQYSSSSKDISQLLISVNHHFYKHTANDRYATLFVGRYSDATRTLHYVNCGHNPPVLLRRGGAVERLDATATVLGLFSDWDCSVAEIRLETGDILCLYTDGITETTGYNREEFGEARLLDALRKNRDLEASYILQNVQNAAEQFRLGEQEDDLTLLIARAL
jgi:ActR/RegA family two-component response regulator